MIDPVPSSQIDCSPFAAKRSNWSNLALVPGDRVDRKPQ